MRVYLAHDEFSLEKILFYDNSSASLRVHLLQENLGTNGLAGRESARTFAMFCTAAGAKRLERERLVGEGVVVDQMADRGHLLERTLCGSCLKL